MRNSDKASINIFEQNISKESEFCDTDQVCYGTHGMQAKAAEEAYKNGQPLPESNTNLPRCHSEVLLLLSMKQIAPLRGYTIKLKNKCWPPCVTPYGRKKKCNGLVEFNPGVPCQTYLSSFASENECTVVILVPGGLGFIPYIYN